jgi:hypothetical protein
MPHSLGRRPLLAALPTAAMLIGGTAHARATL